MIKFIIPTLNAAQGWPAFISALLAAVEAQDVIVLDSSSTDGTGELAKSAGLQVETVRRSEFDHGATRQLGVELAREADVIVFLTQDAIVAAQDMIVPLLAVFADTGVAAAYGRQLPRSSARGIEAHARLFNYPEISEMRDLSSRAAMGFKAIFLSNSFAAYRREALEAIGGFPAGVIMGEDTITAARLLLTGWKIAYVAEASVRHSHAYSWRQEFSRSFDIGVLHSREGWLLEQFGNANGEGRRFVLSELKYLCRNDPVQIPSAVVRTCLKLLGYRLGRIEERLRPAVKRRLSMHRAFWAEHI